MDLFLSARLFFLQRLRSKHAPFSEEYKNSRDHIFLDLFLFFPPQQPLWRARLDQESFLPMSPEPLWSQGPKGHFLRFPLEGESKGHSFPPQLTPTASERHLKLLWRGRGETMSMYFTYCPLTAKRCELGLCMKCLPWRSNLLRPGVGFKVWHFVSFSRGRQIAHTPVKWA